MKNASEIFMEMEKHDGQAKKKDKKKDKKKAEEEDSENGIDLEV